MNQWGNDNGQTDGQPNNNEGSGGGLRQFAEAQQAENKLLKDELAAIRKELGMQKIQSVFDSAGVPGAAALYQGDADPQKAQEWIAQMQSAFGASGAPAPQTQTVEQPPAMTPEQQAQLQRINDAGAAGTPLGTVESAINSAHQVDNLKDLIANFQNATRSQ